MSKGIYILANDSVIENTTALLNSIRCYDKDTPIVIVPYDEKCKKTGSILPRYGAALFDPGRIERFHSRISAILGKYFDRINFSRKFACWTGPFDEFLYLDADIIVFDKIVNLLGFLENRDFLSCDFQHKSGIKQVFLPAVMETCAFTKKEINDVFNAGFFGSKKNIISEERVFGLFMEFLKKKECFVREYSDQSFLNYFVLKYVPGRMNLVKYSKEFSAGSWAGMPHFVRDGNRLIDPHVNQPLKYLHWAGIRIQPGCPYWDVWQYYRNLSTA